MAPKPRGLRDRFPRLYGCWCLFRRYPVAYGIRIENGSMVMDGSSGGGLVMNCTVTGSSESALTIENGLSIDFGGQA